MTPSVGGPWPVGLMLAAAAAAALPDSTSDRAAYAGVALLIIGSIAWLSLLTPAERQGLRDMLRARPLGRAAREPARPST